MKPTPTPNVIEAASFLVDRLEEFERELNDDAVGREYYGHVHPAFARLVAALSVPAEAVVGEPGPIGYCSEYGLDKLASQAHDYCLSVSKAPENEFQFPIYAALSTPDGWQLVPVTPTPEMVTDGRITGPDVEACRYIKDYGDLFRSQWARALRAAPHNSEASTELIDRLRQECKDEARVAYDVSLQRDSWKQDCEYLLDILDGFRTLDGLSEDDVFRLSRIRAALGGKP